MPVNHKLARDRWKQAEDADQRQREREREDLGFYEGEGQWPQDIRDMRKGQIATGGQPALPSRPCITVNKIKDPVRHVINEFLQADLGISVIPADDFGEQNVVDDSEIELREGLIRRIQREPQAQEAQLWGVSRAIEAGRGYFGVMTRDVPGPTMDQEIYFRRFYNQFAVLLDPAHEQPDGSDAEWAFVGTDVPWHVYKVQYAELADGKKNPLLNATDTEWRAYGDDAKDWFTLVGETRSVRVVEYWYYERQAIEYVQLEDGSVVRATAVDSRVLKAIPKERRKRDIVKTVKFAKIDGRNTLEETDWLGPQIPIIKVVGEEMHPFDKERREEGMVRAARGPQQGFNYMITAATELIGLAPKDPPVGAAGQFEGFEDQWDNAAVRTISRLEYNPTPVSANGALLPPPSRQGHEPPIQAMAMMMREYSVAIKDTTGIPDPTLGNVDVNARSGKAIRAMLEQALRGTSNYMANAIRSMHYAGVIVNGLLEPVYGREGRVARIMTPTNETRNVMLKTQFVTAPNGRPQAFDPQQHQGQTPQQYQLTKGGSFNLAVKVSKHFDTKREEEAIHLAELIQVNPEFMMPQYGDLYFKAQDSPGHKELAERARAMLAPPIQKMLAEGQPADPEKQQMQAVIEQMQQALQQAEADKGAKIQSAQIKAQSDAQQTEADNATKLEIEKIRAATALAVADLKASAAQIIESAKAEVEQFRLVIEQEHETRLTDKQRAHEESIAGLEHGHTAALTEREHAHALEQAAQAAALAPEPTEAGA